MFTSVQIKKWRNKRAFRRDFLKKYTKGFFAMPIFMYKVTNFAETIDFLKKLWYNVLRI